MLYPFQSEAINNFWWKQNNGRALLGWEVGTGKTFTGIHIINIIREKFNVKKILIVCPVSLIPTWEYGLIENGVECSVFVNAKKSVETDIVITTYDRLKHIKDDYELLIADEAHRIKNASSKRSRIFRKIANRTRYLLMMTGTISNHRDPSELLNYFWSIGVKGLPRNITQYRDEHCRYIKPPSAQFGWYVSLKSGQQLIDACVKKYVDFKKLREVRDDIPPFIESVRKVEAGFDYKKAIKKLAESMGEEVNMLADDTHIITALQIANGINPLTKKLEDKKKVNAVVETVEEFGGEKIIIWVWWREFGKSLLEVLKKKKYKVELVLGGVTSKKRMEALANFKGESQILIASLGSISEGLNLQYCHNQIVANQWYDVIKDIQSRGRIERTGQKEVMNSVRVVSINSLEEQVLKVVEQKMSMHEANNYLIGTLQGRLK